METVTATITLKELAQGYTSIEIPDDEYAQAERQARKKLARIIEREGDFGGARLQPRYLAQLIAEAIRENRFARFTVELYKIQKEIEEKPTAETVSQS